MGALLLKLQPARSLVFQSETPPERSQQLTILAAMAAQLIEL